MKTEKFGGVAGGEGECGDDVAGWLVRERRSLDILPVKKEAKLSASGVPGEVVGSGEEDLWCRSLLTVCQRRLGLSEAEDTKLEKYSFLEDRMSLWYWLRRDLCTQPRRDRVALIVSGVINKPTTVELCISPVYRRLAAVKFSKSTM